MTEFKTYEEAFSYALRRGGLIHVSILHDDWCASPKGACNCNPSYAVDPMTTESVTRLSKAEREWRERQK